MLRTGDFTKNLSSIELRDIILKDIEEVFELTTRENKNEYNNYMLKKLCEEITNIRNEVLKNSMLKKGIDSSKDIIFKSIDGKTSECKANKLVNDFICSKKIIKHKKSSMALNSELLVVDLIKKIIKRRIKKIKSEFENDGEASEFNTFRKGKLHSIDCFRVNSIPQKDAGVDIKIQVRVDNYPPNIQELVDGLRISSLYNNSFGSLQKIDPGMIIEPEKNGEYLIRLGSKDNANDIGVYKVVHVGVRFDNQNSQCHDRAKSSTKTGYAKINVIFGDNVNMEFYENIDTVYFTTQFGLEEVLIKVIDDCLFEDFQQK